ncbi:MAG: AAA family ATPase [Clostridia bacterium]|nr:AAA family ATPase [Clostridia bacterium]
MRLIECYIENFGKISQQKFTFDSGFNCICQNNGDGKTTLTVFIKVMLYGMSDTKKQMLSENERKHYLPWQGGKCGGYLVVETGGRTYRIERSFAPKAADDTYRRIDVATGKECADTAESFGIEIFGIDADAFERTVFHSERALSSKNENKMISAKLSDLSGTDGDIGGMDDALKLLEEQRKFYQKRGGGGKLSDIRTKISETELRVSALVRTEAELAAIDDKIDSISSEMATLDAEAKRLMSERGEALVLRSQAGNVERYNSTQVRVDELVKRKDELIEFFAGQVPTFETLEKASLYHSRAEQIYKDIKERSADSEEYTELSKIFGETVTREDIAIVRAACERERARETELENLKSSRFGTVFKKRVPTEKEISEISLVEGVKSDKKRLLIPTALALLGAILLAVGLIVNPIICAASAVMLALSALLFITMSQAIKREKDALGKKLADFFESVSGDMPVTDAAALLREMSELRKKLPDTNAGRDDRELLSEFVRACGINDTNLVTAAEEIARKYERYERLKIEKAILEESLKKERSEADRLTVVSRAFTLKYKTTSENPFDEIRKKLTEYNELTSLIVAGHAELAGLKTPSLVRSSERPVSSVEEIDARIRALDTRRAELERTRGAQMKYKEELEYALLEKDTLAATLAQLHEEYTEASEKLNVILLTQKYLDEAKNLMTAKYLGKTKDAFLGYVSLLTGEDDGFELDTTFEVKKIDRGEARPIDAYSKGTRELYNLAAKMAICDSLYSGELPFLVFDDPFSSFDDERVAQAIGLLRKISTERQVIYLTCSSSRAI